MDNSSDSDWPSEIVKGEGLGVYAEEDLVAAVHSARVMTVKSADGSEPTALLLGFKAKSRLTPYVSRD